MNPSSLVSITSATGLLFWSLGVDLTNHNKVISLKLGFGLTGDMCVVC
jgi:hypothetical protein